MAEEIDCENEKLESLKNILDHSISSLTTRGHLKRRNPCDQIIPGLYLGDCAAATSLDHLHLLGITHILNAAEGTDFNQIMTGNDFYQGTPIKYYGISADDDDSYDLSRHFDESSDIIKQVIGTKAQPKNNGKILVHCMAGVSRSPTFVASYLMRDHGMDVNEALKIVSDARFIYPNDGFLKLLMKYNRRLDNKGS